MKIHLVNYEEKFNNGILTKYTLSMMKALKEAGHDVTTADMAKNSVDVNHHINYEPYIYNPIEISTINTLMITHITNNEKLKNIKRGMGTANAGICFSKDTQDYLENNGIKNLFTVLPAHDGLRKPKTIAILTNLYADGRKNEQLFLNIIKTINKDAFFFLIMGSGWESLLKSVQDKINFTYFDKFDSDIYTKILSSSDYSLYFGEDEGSMGILDSVSCGLHTIAPLSGFHKEIGIDYPFKTEEDLKKILDLLSTTRVINLTWNNYVKKHINIWQKIKKEL